MNFSRRKIIKSLGMVAGATAAGLIPGISVFANDKKEQGQQGWFNQSEGFSAVLIGAGKRGQKFGKFAKNNPGQLRIVAIGEPIEERRKTLANNLGLPESVCQDNGEKALQQNPQATVAIIAASGNYTADCKTALRAGYHVWVDRPVSLDPDEVIAVNQLAAACKRNISFCYIHDGKLNLMDHRLFEKNPAKA